MSTQLLNALRTKVISEPDLWVDVLGILDTMAARFEAAKNEMAAAQGLIWENNTWDFAAEHLKMKKSRVEKWCEMVTIAAGERRSPPTDVHNSVHEWNRETMDVLPGQSVDDFGWATSNYDWDTMQWESVLFDELLQDIQS
ncbi:hypothetical protein DE146DRAFT_793124 [Phaeosphaeria sp. MPI-PUGE-AT-0046c]|nr:hypothetical protein DE146DRAFT_793124 [Phaeosphaeria sp. MPI-PUGE-AT-0046c]